MQALLHILQSLRHTQTYSHVFLCLYNKLSTLELYISSTASDTLFLVLLESLKLIGVPSEPSVCKRPISSVILSLLISAKIPSVSGVNKGLSIVVSSIGTLIAIIKVEDPKKATNCYLNIYLI